MTARQPSRNPVRAFWRWFVDVVETSSLNQLDAIMLALFVFGTGCFLLLMIYGLTLFSHVLKFAVSPNTVPSNVYASNVYAMPQPTVARFGHPRRTDAALPQPLAWPANGQAAASSYQQIY